ncbi:hypothetical protein [Embleya sp. NBC_00896]|nr:hypothetical protein OG928_34610 [Embleya sp. NBC_00896]
MRAWACSWVIGSVVFPGTGGPIEVDSYGIDTAIALRSDRGRRLARVTQR